MILVPYAYKTYLPSHAHPIQSDSFLGAGIVLAVRAGTAALGTHYGPRIRRLIVCDNLAFTSEIVVSKKHTRFGQERYLERISQAVSGLQLYQEAAANWIDRLQGWNLSEDAANSYLLQAYETDVIGARLLPLVIKEWRNPRFDEYKPRTGWSLWNCFTDVLKAYPRTPAVRSATMAN